MADPTWAPPTGPPAGVPDLPAAAAAAAVPIAAGPEVGAVKRQWLAGRTTSRRAGRRQVPYRPREAPRPDTGGTPRIDDVPVLAERGPSAPLKISWFVRLRSAVFLVLLMTVLGVVTTAGILLVGFLLVQVLAGL
jgi:hypothetical protein